MTIHIDTFHHCTIVSEHRPQSVTTAIGVWLENGVRYENEQQSGYAHFFEHLVFKGTENLSGQQLSRQFEKMGGQINAETGRELTAFYGHTPSTYSIELLSLILDMLLKTRFSREEFELERDVVLQELAMLDDDPQEALEDAATEKVWADHPMGRQILGNERSLRAANYDDFLDYIQSLLHDSRLYIVAVGQVDREALSQLIQSYDRHDGRKKVSTPPLYRASRDQLPIHAEQKHLAWVMPAVAYTDKHAPLYDIANHILAGGYDSYLYQCLREQHGLVYSIDSRNDHYADSGLWFIQTNTDPDNSARCIELVDSTMQFLANSGPSQESLENTIQHLQSRLIIESEDPECRLDYLAQNFIYRQRIPDLQEQLQKYAQFGIVDLKSLYKQAWKHASCFMTQTHE